MSSERGRPWKPLHRSRWWSKTINNGIHLARQIREGPPTIPLFIVSAMTLERDVRDFLVKHRLEFFPKTAESPNDGFAKLFARTDSILRGLKEQQQSHSNW